VAVSIVIIKRRNVLEHAAARLVGIITFDGYIIIITWLVGA
jgi:hypothetical protein